MPCWCAAPSPVMVHRHEISHPRGGALKPRQWCARGSGGGSWQAAPAATPALLRPLQPRRCGPRSPLPAPPRPAGRTSMKKKWGVPWGDSRMSPRLIRALPIFGDGTVKPGSSPGPQATELSERGGAAAAAGECRWPAPPPGQRHAVEPPVRPYLLSLAPSPPHPTGHRPQKQGGAPGTRRFHSPGAGWYMRVSPTPRGMNC